MATAIYQHMYYMCVNDRSNVVNDRCCKLTLTVQYENNVDRRICSKWQIRNEI